MFVFSLSVILGFIQRPLIENRQGQILLVPERRRTRISGIFYGGSWLVGYFYSFWVQFEAPLQHPSLPPLLRHPAVVLSPPRHSVLAASWKSLLPVKKKSRRSHLDQASSATLAWSWWTHRQPCDTHSASFSHLTLLVHLSLHRISSTGLTAARVRSPRLDLLGYTCYIHEHKNLWIKCICIWFKADAKLSECCRTYHGL